MKKLLLGLLISNLLVVPAHGMMSRFACAIARNAKRMKMPVLPKIGMQSLPKTIAKPAQIYKSFKPSLMVNNAFIRSTLKKISIKNTQIPFKIMPTLGGLAASAATAQAQGKDKPAFNSANVKKYHWDMPTRKAFLDHALTQITTKDKDIIDTIATMLEHYPECQVPITNAALAQFNDAHPMLLKHILSFNPQAAKEYMKLLLETENPHFHDVFNDSGLKNSILWKPDYVWCFGNQSGEKTFPLAQYIIDNTTQNPDSISIKAFNKLYHRIRVGRWNTRELVKAAIKYYGQDVKTLLLLYKKALTLKDITTKPHCVYLGRVFDTVSIFDLGESVTHSVDSWSLNDMHYVYQELENYRKNWMTEGTIWDLFAAMDQQKKIRNTAIAHFGIKTVSDPFKTLEDPDFQKKPENLLAGCTASRPADTITQCHVCKNFESVAQVIRTRDKASNDPNVKNMFAQAHAKQKSEQAKSNYVFFHGRVWGWDFLADVYKHAFNLTKNAAEQVKDDFTFLRFDDSKRRSWGGDPLYMNAALYGNSQNPGSCTAEYVMDGSDMSGDIQKRFNPNTILTRFNLQKYYAKYQNEFDQLKNLHSAANPKTYGSLLAVSVPANEVNNVTMARWKPLSYLVLGTKYVLDSAAVQDHYEFTLPLNKNYALDPKKGPRIYAMNACDPAKYKKYTDYRDRLFAHIKAEIASPNNSDRNNEGLLTTLLGPIN